MYGIISGVADNGIVNYCPVCGEDLLEFLENGVCFCNSCGTYFAVIECEKED